MRKNYSPVNEQEIIIRRRLNRGETYSFTVLSKDWNYQRFTVTKDARANLSYILNNLLDRITIWEQGIESSIIDTVRKWESCRIYSILLAKGANTIYFTSEAGLFQVDLFDHNRRLIISKDSCKREFFLDVDAHYDGSYTLSVYPSLPVKLGAYVVISAKGRRIFPYYNKILLLLLSGAVIFIIFWIKSLIIPKKFSGRIRQK